MTTFKHTPAEARAALVDALRSGRFTQGRSCLRDADDRFCCLGVACQLFTELEPQAGLSWQGRVAAGWKIAGTTVFLPELVRAWLGFHDILATLNEPIGRHVNLTELNDKGHDFESIAAIIETGKVKPAIVRGADSPHVSYTMRESTEKIVGVWYDETPEPEHRAWIVADEEIFADGEADTTSTISTHETREAAIEAGEARAASRGVRCVVQDNARTWGN